MNGELVEMTNLCREKDVQLDNYKREIERLNNIIENTIKKCVYLLENNEIEINNKKYYKQKCDDIITQFILQELKGSGSNE